MPRPSQPPHPRASRHAGRAASSTASALRILAGVITVAAVIGGAGWLLRQRSRRRPGYDAAADERSGGALED